MTNFNLSELGILLEWIHALQNTHNDFLMSHDYELYFKMASLKGSKISMRDIDGYNASLKNKIKRIPTMLNIDIVNNLIMYDNKTKVKYNGRNNPLSVVANFERKIIQE